MDSPYTTSSSNVDPWRNDLDDQSPPPNIFFDLTPRDHGAEGSMTSLGLSPMELEQLPNFFSLPPCAPYKYGHLADREYPPKGPHDIADALLSLKHAVVHPEFRGPLSPLSPPPSAQTMPHFAPPQYGGQHMSGYGIPSPTPYPHGHYHNGHSVSQSLGYSVNQHTSSGQSSYGPQSMGHHHQYAQYDHCQSPSMQHSIPSANVHFPSMSVNVSMNMNVGVPANLDAGQYSAGSGGVATLAGSGQNWPIPPVSPSMPPPPPAVLPHYHSSGPSNHYPHCNGYSGQSHAFSHLSTDYRSVSADHRPPVYYKPVTDSFKEGKFCQVNHHHHHHHLHEHILKRPRFGSERSLTNSSALDSGMAKTNQCSICFKTYARPSTLKTHLRTHSGEKPYKCDQCGKTFSQAANLTAHLRTHSGEKPFHCPMCQRRFSQSSSVTTHMRTHNGDRPYVCPYSQCKKAFSDSSTLTKHLRIHTGEKPYECELCKLKFSQSGNLNRHKRVHSSNA